MDMGDPASSEQTAVSRARFSLKAQTMWTAVVVVRVGALLEARLNRERRDAVDCATDRVVAGVAVSLVFRSV